MLALHSACWLLGVPPVGQPTGSLAQPSALKQPPMLVKLTEPSPMWKEGMGHHTKLNDMTTDEWQSILKHRIYEQHQADKFQRETDHRIASDNHKLKAMQHIADHVNTTVYAVLAFEGCATSCDVRHWCQHPPCDLSGVTDALLQHISNFNMKDVWSSCHSGCSLGLRAKDAEQCKGSCQGESKSPFFCQEACTDYSSKVKLFTPKDAYTKRLDARTGFWDREALQAELSAAKAEVTRLHSKLAKSEQRQVTMFANPHLAKVAALASATKAATAKAAINMADVEHT